MTRHQLELYEQRSSSNVFRCLENFFRTIGRPFEDEFKDVLTNMESDVDRVEDAVRLTAYTEQVSTHEGIWLSP